VALDLVGYAPRGSGALSSKYYEHLATMAVEARSLLGYRTILVNGLSPASMIVMAHAGINLTGTLSWVSSANYGRLILETGEQIVPAKLQSKQLSEALAKCACPVCKTDARTRDEIARYLNLKSEEMKPSVYPENSPRGIRVRCVHNAYALIKMMENINEYESQHHYEDIRATSYVALGLHLTRPVMAGLITIDHLRRLQSREIHERRRKEPR
jgi:queuine/archaeosine tRNA-ribosyltransferase